MSKASKKLRKLKNKLDDLEEKEHEILDQIDDTIGELEFEEETKEKD